MFAEKLKEFRKNNNLTLPEMANFLGVPFSTYEKWEYRQNEPDKFKKNIILEKLNNYVK